VSFDKRELELTVRYVGYPVEAVEAVLWNLEQHINQTGTKLWAEKEDVVYCFI